MCANWSEDTEEYYKCTRGGQKKNLWLGVGMRKDLGWKWVEFFSGLAFSLAPGRTFATSTDADEGET